MLSSSVALGRKTPIAGTHSSYLCSPDYKNLIVTARRNVARVVTTGLGFPVPTASTCGLVQPWKPPIDYGRRKYELHRCARGWRNQVALFIKRIKDRLRLTLVVACEGGRIAASVLSGHDRFAEQRPRHLLI